MQTYTSFDVYRYVVCICTYIIHVYERLRSVVESTKILRAKIDACKFFSVHLLLPLSTPPWLTIDPYDS